MPVIARTMLLALCLTLLPPSVRFAHADKPAGERNADPEAAKQAVAEFEQGRALYQQQQYAAAVPHFSFED